MKLNKEKFLKSEFGGELECVIRSWDIALQQDRNRTETLRDLAWCQAQWEVYKMALKHFYGIEYYFSRTDEYFGICTEDESDWLFKFDRELTKSTRYEVTKEDIKEAMRKTREMQRIAREYKSNIPDQSETSAMGLVLGRAAEVGKITL